MRAAQLFTGILVFVITSFALHAGGRHQWQEHRHHHHHSCHAHHDDYDECDD